MAVAVRLELARMKDAVPLASLSREEVEYGLEWRWTPRRIARAIQDPETEVLLARIDEAVAGFAVLELGVESAHLVLFAVSPAHRRQGVGRALFTWLQPLAVNAGLGHVHLEVRHHNQGAQDFYRKLGFRAQRLVPGYYQGVEDAVRMVLPLGAT